MKIKVLRFSILMAVFVLASAYISAQEDTSPKVGQIIADQSNLVEYNGKLVDKSKLLATRSQPIYCSQIITRQVIARGYFDGRADRLVCYDTNREALLQSDRNIQFIQSLTPSTPSKVINPEQEGQNLSPRNCTGDRSAQYWAALYNDWLGDVCSGRTQLNLNGSRSVKSIWQTDQDTGDGSCPRVHIKENYFPPAYSYVDYSSAFLNFIYVDWVKWTPKSC